MVRTTLSPKEITLETYKYYPNGNQSEWNMVKDELRRWSLSVTIIALTSPTFSNPLRVAIWCATLLSILRWKRTRNELVKTLFADDATNVVDPSKKYSHPNNIALCRISRARARAVCAVAYISLARFRTSLVRKNEILSELWLVLFCNLYDLTFYFILLVAF